ncbi:MAG: hypothetical protein AB7O96_18460 [Pseudobdellovibrionaceae bacterium]
MRTFRLFYLVAVISLVFGACGGKPYHKPNEAKRVSKTQPRPLPPENELSWENVSARVFAIRCDGCHKKFQVYENVKHEIDDIEMAVFMLGTMPKEGTLTEAESRLLEAWIQAGAPEKAPDQVPAPLPAEP